MVKSNWGSRSAGILRTCKPGQQLAALKAIKVGEFAEWLPDLTGKVLPEDGKKYWRPLLQGEKLEGVPEIGRASCRERV